MLVSLQAGWSRSKEPLKLAISACQQMYCCDRSPWTPPLRAKAALQGKGDSAVPNTGTVPTVSKDKEPNRGPAVCFQLPYLLPGPLSICGLKLSVQFLEFTSNNYMERFKLTRGLG